MQANAAVIFMEPPLPVFSEIVTWTIIDDEKDLTAPVTSHKQSKESPEGAAVEHVGKLIRKARVFQANGAEDMGCLSLTIGIDSGLLSDSGPSLVERSVEPETRFVAEEDHASAGGRFFFIAGNVFFNHTVCRLASARASRRLGRCTEKPSLCSRHGM